MTIGIGVLGLLALMIMQLGLISRRLTDVADANREAAAEVQANTLAFQVAYLRSLTLQADATASQYFQCDPNGLGPMESP